jgi:hypothetical protein
MKTLFIIPILLIVFTPIAGAQAKSDVKRVGIFKEIDVARHNTAIELLNGASGKDKRLIIDSILHHPNHYNPAVLYVLSRELFRLERKEATTYWFYLAQLRARYDANRCADISAKQAVAVLNLEFGPDINKYAFKNS